MFSFYNFDNSGRVSEKNPSVVLNKQTNVLEEKK